MSLLLATNLVMASADRGACWSFARSYSCSQIISAFSPSWCSVMYCTRGWLAFRIRVSPSPPKALMSIPGMEYIFIISCIRLLFHLFLGLLGSLGLQGIGHIRINTLELDSLVLFLPQKGCSHKFHWQWRSVWTVPLCLSRVLFHIPQTLWHIPAGFPGPIPSTYAPNLCTDTAIAVHSSPVPVLRSATGKLLQKRSRRI